MHGVNESRNGEEKKKISLFCRSSNYHRPKFVYIFHFSLVCVGSCYRLSSGRATVDVVAVCRRMESLICEAFSPFACFCPKEFIGFVAKVEPITASIRSIGRWCVGMLTAMLAWHLCIHLVNLFTSRTANRDKFDSSERNTSKTCRGYQWLATTCCYCWDATCERTISI